MFTADVQERFMLGDFPELEEDELISRIDSFAYEFGYDSIDEYAYQEFGIDSVEDLTWEELTMLYMEGAEEWS